MNAMVTFDEPSHTYQVNGKHVPSVTQVLSVLSDFSKVPWQVMERARERGQLVHEAGELLIRDELDWSSIDSEIQAYLVGLRKFLKDTAITILSTEQVVCDPSMGYAGTLDAIGYWRRGRALFDWKTSLALPSTVGPQLSAYAHALKVSTGEDIRRRYCVRLSPGDYRIDKCADPVDWSTFVSCLNIHKFKERHAA